MAAAGSPDLDLARTLEQGFPLVGHLPPAGNLEFKKPKKPSGNLEPKKPKEPKEPEALLRDAWWNNESILARAANPGPVEPAVAEAFAAKVAEEIEAGKAEWVPLDRAMAGGVITPRFPVDEGLSTKADGSVKRKVGLCRPWAA